MAATKSTPRRYFQQFAIISTLSGAVLSGTALTAVLFVPIRFAAFFTIIATALVSFTFGLVAALVVVYLGGKLETVMGNPEVKATDTGRFGRLFHLKATGAISAFLLVFWSAFRLLSAELTEVRAVEDNARRQEARKARAIRLVNQKLGEIGKDLPPGIERRNDRDMHIDRELDALDGLLAELENEIGDDEFKADLQRMNRLRLYFRASRQYCRENYAGALVTIDGLSGEAAPMANFDFLRARCRYNLIQDEQALAAFNLVLDRYPRDIAVLCFQASTLARLQRFKDAKKAYTAVITAEPFLVMVRDTRIPQVVGWLGKISCDFHGRANKPNDFGPVQGLDADVKNTIALLEQLATKPDEQQERIRLWRRTMISLYRFAAGIETNPTKKFAYYDEGVTLARDMLKNHNSAEVRIELGLILFDRGAEHRKGKNITQAYQDSKESGEVLDSLENPQGKSLIDRELIAQSHLNAGEVALGLGAEFLQEGESHLHRVVELVDREMSNDNLSILRGRANATLAIIHLRKRNPEIACKIAVDIVTRIAPLESKYPQNDSLRLALTVARRILSLAKTN